VKAENLKRGTNRRGSQMGTDMNETVAVHDIISE
jgi:hypothetical protein